MSFFQYLLIFLLLPSFPASHIFSQPSSLSNQHALTCSSISIPLLLSTPLLANEYLYIKLPFPIGTLSSFSISRLSFQFESASILAVSSQADPEFLLQTPIDLPSNLWLNFTLLISDPVSQVAGIHGCIQMKTLSSGLNGLLYDENPCIDTLALADPIDSTGFTVVASYATADLLNKELFATTYRAFFDVTPHRTLAKGAQFILEIGDLFAFDYPCLNSACVASSTDCATNLATLTGSTACQIQGKKLVFAVEGPITKTTFRITVNIVNPTKYVTAPQVISATFRTNSLGFVHGFVLVSPASQNPLSLKTSYASITVVTNTVKLLWGVLPQTDATKDGCPLTLFTVANPTTIPIYNNMRSEFSFSSSISSFAGNSYLKFSWFLVTGGTGSLSTPILSSLSTNLPIASKALSSSFVKISDKVVLTGIGSLLTAKTYYISCRFSLSYTAYGQTTIKSGGFEVATGEDEAILSATGTAIPIRQNREYIDTTATTGWFSSPASRNFYNFLYSFKASEMNLLLDASTNPLSAVYTTITSNFFSTSSKVGVFARPKSATGVYSLFLVLYAGTNKLCKNGLMNDIATRCGSSTSADGMHILMKIIFNNNVLNIDFGNFAKGVMPIGTLFSKSDGTNPGYMGYDTAASQGRQLNFISSTSDSAGGIFHHVTLVCMQGASVDYCHSILGRTASTVSGLAFVDVNIDFFPGLYMDSYVFDMILCFKVMRYGNFLGYITMLEAFFTLYEDDANKGGPGVFHGYVLHGGRPVDSYAFYSNFYTDGTNFGNGLNIASYLRVSVNFGAEIFATGSYLAVFFSDNSLADLQLYSDATSTINCLEMAGSSSQITGRILEAPFALNSEDFWWQQKGVLLTKAILASTDYIFFIPMRISSSKLNSVTVAIMADSSLSTLKNYQAKAIYRINGSPYLMSLTKTFTGSNSAALFTDLTATFTTDSSNGCLTTGSSSVPHFNAGNAAIKPGTTILNLEISAGLATVGTGLACPLALNTASNHGAIFAVYTRDAIFSNLQAFTWTYAGSSVNKCAFHQISLQSGSTSLFPKFETILCTLDPGTEVPAISSSGSLSISSFTVPFFWGTNYPLGVKLQHVWSLNTGLGVSMILDPADSTGWFLSTCSISLVSSVPIDTKDVFYTLAIKNMVKYELLQGASLVVKETVTGAISLSYLACFSPVKALSCAYSATGVFTLANSQSALLVIAGNSLVIYALVDTPAVFAETTHSAEIEYDGRTIEKCSTEEPTRFAVSGGKIRNTVILSNFLYVRMPKARGSFQFTFTLSRNLRKTNVFLFNWGYFASAFALAKDFSCHVLEASKEKSHKFASLTTSDALNFQLSLKEDVSGGGGFIMRCIGVETSDMSSETAISAQYTRQSDGVVISAGESLGFESIATEKILTGVTLSKKFITKGFESDYSFTFRPLSKDIDFVGRIYVEFSLGIAPLLNSLGFIQCYLNSLPAFCEITAERRVAVSPNLLLNATSENYYELVISGVLQPKNADSNWQVYFALDDNSDPYDGIVEQAFINEPVDSSGFIKELFIQDMVLSTQYMRTALDLELQLLVPADSITSSTQLFLQLPKSFHESFELSTNLQCSVTRVGDSRQQELASYCGRSSSRRILLILADNANSQVLSYKLKISGLFSPEHASLPREDLKVFISSDNVTILASTISSLRNTSEFLNFTTSGPETVQLDFFDVSLTLVNSCDVYQGSFRAFLALGPNSGNFASTFNWSFLNPANATFLVSPSALQIDVGSRASYFSLATDQNTVTGQYFLTAVKTEGFAKEKFSAIPTMRVRVRNEPFQLKTSQSLYIVPYGGKSAPITVDFSAAIPMSDVSLTANVSFGYDSYYISIEGEQTKTKKLVFSEGNPHKLVFYANSYSQNSLSGSPLAVISWILAGTNAEAYLPPAPVQIQVIDSASFQKAPVARTPTIAISAGASLLSSGCDQIGTLYYALGIDAGTNSATSSFVQNVTEYAQISQTSLDASDKDYMVYGFEVVNVENEPVEFTVKAKLKALGSYTLRVFCLNLANINSEVSANLSWIQPDNNSKKFRIGLVYQTKLTSALKLEIACAFLAFFKLNPERVRTDEGNMCQINNARTLQKIENLRFLQDFEKSEKSRFLQIIENPATFEKVEKSRFLQNSSNSSNSTIYTNSSNLTISSNSSNSSISANLSATTIPSNYTYYWYFLKNYTSEADDLLESASSSFEAATFYSSILALTSSGSSKFPALVNSSFEENPANSSQVPLLSSSLIEASATFLAFRLTITNEKGYIFAGIGTNATKKPSASQLKQGKDANGSLLVQWDYAYQENQGLAQSFNFTNLTSKSYYHLYYVASGEDPTEDGAMSNVVARTVFTYGERSGCEWLMIVAIFAVFITV